MPSKRILVVAGARPNFIKIAPLWHTLIAQKDFFEPIIVHTGQHYDMAMSEQFFIDLDLPKPHVNLEVGSASHAVQTAKIMVRFEEVCFEYKPDLVVVVGDVNSTMACALVAAKLFIPVAHVEAGLRSFDRRMPEEVNRLVTDALSDLLFTPSRDADVNLEREGVERRKIFFVGNVMIDSLVRNLDKVHATRAYEALGFRPKEYAYVSLHRPSNVDSRESLALIMEALERLASTLPIVFPLHPRTRKMLDAFSLAQRTPSSLRLIEPVGYLSSLSLAQNAALVLTDSGGLQEETTFFRTPCLTLRPNTERPVTITQGTNKLTSLDCLWEDIETRLNCKSVPSATPELWDGNTSPRIAVVLRTFLGSDTSTDN